MEWKYIINPEERYYNGFDWQGWPSSIVLVYWSFPLKKQGLGFG